ncbi:uncharacterized protein LOC130719266 [Lotus japonicus]|uniref:uncharacterized protein LOC130719266 n=1 Tax=Lotus japonicus TaxID=34305 RepID=UPI0025861E5A|nr:uncharacterized protein LOC130719266 [Lotus japonicus]
MRWYSRVSHVFIILEDRREELSAVSAIRRGVELLEQSLEVLGALAHSPESSLRGRSNSFDGVPSLVPKELPFLLFEEPQLREAELVEVELVEADPVEAEPVEAELVERVILERVFVEVELVDPEVVGGGVGDSDFITLVMWDPLLCIC